MQTSWGMPGNHVGEETASAALKVQLWLRLVGNMTEGGSGEGYRNTHVHVCESWDSTRESIKALI